LDVSAELQRRGYRGRVASIARLRYLEEEIATRRREGVFGEEFFEEYLSGFVFAPPEDMPGARSLIVVAVPDPPVRFTFMWKGRRFPLVVPPTYLRGREVDKRAENALMEILGPAGYRVPPATVPKKLLAVRSGLAAYGKNNVTYVPGMGSFFRLAAFFSDLPPPADDGWREPALLERCRECELCRRACPTGAIGADRFLLHAERCITFHNEQPPEVPFPAWLAPAWHDNCIVGCLRCQRACPENEKVRTWFEDAASFSAEETALLLRGVPLERLPAETAEKLNRTGLARFVEYLPRNLGVLVERKIGKHGQGRTPAEGFRHEE
jgi:epoxyqueuosine reductase